MLPAIELPCTTVGAPYEVRLTATGGVAPLRYAVKEVPPGFSFYADSGLLTGPATEAGDFTLKVSVTDAEGAQDTRVYALEVRGSTSDGGVPDAGVAFPLEVGNWNIEWFGDTGPTGGPPTRRSSCTTCARSSAIQEPTSGRCKRWSTSITSTRSSRG